MSDVKIFNRWGTEGIAVQDPGLRDYITIEPKMVPRTGGKYAGNRFYKSRITIVERLINKMMVPGHKGKKHNKSSGHCTGKGTTASKLVEEALSIVEKRTNENPVKVLVKAVENAAPREEIVTIEYGGARYPKAVECSPQRRVDLALRYFSQGAYQKSFGTKKSASEAIAEEIVLAYQSSAASNAIAKKNEIERQADASR